MYINHRIEKDWNIDILYWKAAMPYAGSLASEKVLFTLYSMKYSMQVMAKNVVNMFRM